MPTATNVQTSATLSADTLSDRIADALLDRPEKTTVFYGLGQKNSQPLGTGKSTTWVRYEYLALPSGPLEEGVTPTATDMRISSVQATVEQWGAYITLTDMAQKTVKHAVAGQARSLLTDQHRQTLDREAQMPLLGTSGVMYANGKTARSSLTASDVLTSDDVRKAVATLRYNGARPYNGRYYAGVHDPYVEGDLNKDATFVSGATDAQIERLNDFVTSAWMGVQWMRSNLIPIVSLLGGSARCTVDTGTNPAGLTEFDANSTVYAKVTRLDPLTRYETQIEAQATLTSASAFCVAVSIASGDPTGVYFAYCTLQDGATGTATRQVRINHTTGTATTIYLGKAGAPTGGNAFVVTASGAVAPPSPASGVNVHISYILGNGALGVLELGGMETTNQSGGDSDPLEQRMHFGWKQPLKGVLLNPDFVRRIESASAYN